MLTLKGRKRVLIIGGAAIILIGSLVIFLSSADENHEEPQENLSSLFKDMPAFTTPDESHVAKMQEFINRTTDVKEKAQAYRTLGHFYTQIGNPKDALDAYKQAKSMADQAGFSQQEKDELDNHILALEYQVEVNNNAGQEIEGGFREPDE